MENKVTKEEKLTIQNYVEEVRKIKLLQLDAKSMQKSARINKNEALLMVIKQENIADSLSSSSFNRLKSRFQTVLKKLKREICAEGEMNTYPQIMDYTFAEGANMAFKDLRGVLEELNIKEIQPFSKAS